MQSIESQDLSIAKLIDDFYLVPDYQREYVWRDVEVEQLFSDIYEEFSSKDSAPNSEYFIGSIVVCPHEDKVLELIDGQQRMTTIYLFLCALRDFLKKQNAPEIVTLNQQIAATDIDENGNDIYRYRVELQYEDSGDILKDIARSIEDSSVLPEKTRSMKNIKNAYITINTFLTKEFGSDINSLKKFYSYFTKNVKIIRIRTQSVAHALKIFETINDRGVGLDAMDLLKNLLFMHSREDQFGKLKTVWKDLVDTLYSINEKPLRFLRYYILATYDEDRLKEEEIYNWFKDHENICGYRREPLKFANELLNAAQSYALFSKGKDFSGEFNRYLDNIRYLSGAAKQHYILLLAARKMPPTCFNSLCRNVENLFFTYIITRENTREFERKFALWANELRAVQNEVQLNEFLDQRFYPAKKGLISRFDLIFDNLDTTSIQKYRIRYILAKLTQYINEEAYGSVGAEINLQTYINSKIHVEHILPQDLTQDVLSEFDYPEKAKEYNQKLGNLTLAEESINTSLGNKPFSKKLSVYRNSKFLLTKGICEKVVIGKNTSIDRAVKEIIPFSQWTTVSIESRQQMMKNLSHQVWDMPYAE